MFSFTITFNLPFLLSQVPFEGGMLEVEVWDWDRIGSHDAMGVAKIPLSKLSDELLHDEWHTLVPRKKEKVSGEIRLRTQFTSALVCDTIVRKKKKEKT